MPPQKKQQDPEPGSINYDTKGYDGYQPPNPFAIAKKDLGSLTVDELTNFERISDVAKAVTGKFNPQQSITPVTSQIQMVKETFKDVSELMTAIKELQGPQPIHPATAEQPSMFLSALDHVLNSKFAEAAGANLDKHINALSTALGKERVEALGDAALEKIGGKVKENEQAKFMREILNMNPNNILDVHKFMDFAIGPDGQKIASEDQARMALINEQKLIIQNNPQLLEGTNMQKLLNNPPMAQAPNFAPGPLGPINNQISPEAVMNIDINNDESVKAWAWSKNLGGLITQPNGMNRIRKMLQDEQSQITDQMMQSGIAGSPVVTELPQETNFGWEDTDVGNIPQEARTPGGPQTLPKKDVMEQMFPGQYASSGPKNPMDKKADVMDMMFKGQIPIEAQDPDRKAYTREEFNQEIGMADSNDSWRDNDVGKVPTAARGVLSTNDQQQQPPVPQPLAVNDLQNMLQEMINNFNNNMASMSNNMNTLNENMTGLSNNVTNVSERMSKLEDRIVDIEEEFEQDYEQEQDSTDTGTEDDPITTKSIEQEDVEPELVEQESVESEGLTEKLLPIKGKMLKCKIDKDNNIIQIKDKNTGEWVDYNAT